MIKLFKWESYLIHVPYQSSFQKSWTCWSSYWAKRSFDQRLDRINRANIEEMKKAPTMLKRHEELIFN